MSLAQLHRSAATQPQWTAASVRRPLDLVVAIVGLIVFAPLMIIVAIAVWLDVGRPIFFSQVRLGQGGRRFRIYKFRKFSNDAGAGGRGVTVKRDARMTRLGRLLEATKVDELPQLWNIIKGDMAIVGPRPESLDFLDCFAGDYPRLLEHRPGIFGPNQVLFRNEGALYPEGSNPETFYRNVLFPLKARIDLAYFPHRTMFSDLGWIIRGLLAVFGCLSLPLETMEAVLRADVAKQFSQSAGLGGDG